MSVRELIFVLPELLVCFSFTAELSAVAGDLEGQNTEVSRWSMGA